MLTACLSLRPLTCHPSTLCDTCFNAFWNFREIHLAILDQQMSNLRQIQIAIWNKYNVNSLSSLSLQPLGAVAIRRHYVTLALMQHTLHHCSHLSMSFDSGWYIKHIHNFNLQVGLLPPWKRYKIFWNYLQEATQTIAVAGLTIKMSSIAKNRKGIWDIGSLGY